jgi:hypothetical protein
MSYVSYLRTPLWYIASAAYISYPSNSHVDALKSTREANEVQATRGFMQIHAICKENILEVPLQSP